MNNETKNLIDEYLSKVWIEFDESTLIIPNKNKKNENNEIDKLDYELDKKNLIKFCKSNSIRIEEVLLASLTLTLNKFNYTYKTLIFNPNNIPFPGNFKNREISIKKFLKKIQKSYNKTLEFDEYYNPDKLPLKTEFYYSFNENLKTDSEYSNYLKIVENTKTVSLSLFYHKNLYTEDFINLFLSCLKNIIKQIINADLDKTNICDIALVSEKEISFSEVENPLIHKRLEKQALENGDKIALVAADGTLTYNQFNQKANIIANALIEKGIKPKSNILVMLKRDSNLIASIFAILKAGCAFIPIDPDYPEERINYIYNNCQADYIISNETGENTLNIEELLKETNNENPNVKIEADDLAYIIYTSGSTGNPKGVMITHKNVCNQSESNTLADYNSILSMATISFTASLQDIFSGLTNGHKLIFASEIEIKNIVNLIKLLKSNEPEIMVITPSRLLSFFEVDEFYDAFKCFKAIIMGGEQFSVKAYNIIKENSDISVLNGYGQSEVTGGSSVREVTDPYNITICNNLKNSITDIRDIDGKLVPNGIIGQLHIGGYNVGKGYYNLDKTKETFVEINGINYCKTGDYAVKISDNHILIKGRIDNQIKLRGLRIEIDEIKFNISNYPNIKENVVVIKKINNNDHLCAYYTANKEIDKNSLKNYLSERLTNYMVPTAFMQLDEMPINPNGKVYLNQLPEPILEFENIKSKSPIEEKLFEMISESTNTSNFGVTDDLYALGFTSLSLIKFNADIYKKFDVNLDIVDLLDNPTIRHIANLIDENKFDENINKLIKSSKELTYYPLMDNQLGVYYECAQNPDEAQYNLPVLIRFDKSIDPLKLKKSIIKTIDSYPYLKTRIVLHEGQLMHKRDDSIPIDEIPIIKINEISNEEIKEENVKRFELLNNQLFRGKIYETKDEIILFFDIHHIISDGESIGTLFNNFAKAYNGEDIEKEVFNGYICSLIEKEGKSSEKYLTSEKYFHEQLRKDVDSSILTPDLNNDDELATLKYINKKIDSKLIKEFCAAKRISPNILFMSSTILTLNKYTFNDKTLLTTIFNGRLNSNYYNTQSFLVKTLPIVSINEDRNISIRQFFNQIDEIWKNGIKHSNYPYINIAEEFNLKPEFMYTYNNLGIGNIKLDNKSYKIVKLNSLETNYKISFDVNENEDEIELSILYNNGLYSEKYIKTFLDSVLSTLNQFINGNIEELKINEIELNTSEELTNFIPVENPIIHKRFEKQAIEKSDNIALVAGDSTLTYSELNKKSNRIANALIKKGIKPKSNILVMLPRDSNLIATIIGILKAGCTFVPIDLEYPKERINYIYKNSQADYIINTNGKTNNTLNINELIKEKNTENPNIDISPDDLAYMIYTSGSTGKPKGVMISHKNACNEVAENPKCQYKSILSIATIAFDTSLEDILTGITNGIKIIFANDTQIKNIPDLITLINKTQPEVIEFTPSRLNSYLEINEFTKAINCSKCIVMGGEQFSAKAFRKVKQHSNAKVYNSYGPTEATIASNYQEITNAENITVGKPLKNYITEVRDIDGKLLPQGVIGELYIGGTGVGKGYYNMPEKTKERFITIDNIPYYKSGDYAIKLPNDEIDIKGRIDNQIKLRGLRIEIGEIETNINKYPKIKQTIVLIKEINGYDHLCAYYTGEEEINSEDLKEYLKDHLTRYMIPTVFIQVDKFPQTPNGKTDLKQLPEPKLKLSKVLPETETEEKIMDIVLEFTQTKEFGITDDLYALGFTSLTLMKLNGKIYEEIGVNLDIIPLLNEPTIKNIAREIDVASDEYNINKLIELSKDKEYFPLTENQLGIYYECMQNPAEIKYTMPSKVIFDNDVNPDKLKESIIKTIESHPYLKTRIIIHDGELKQKRCDDIVIEDIEIVKTSTISDKEIIENDVKPFDLNKDQLCRFKIYDVSDSLVLFSDFHHIITDGVSHINLFNEIANNYENREIEEEIVDGYVYSLIEENISNSDKYQSSKLFFKDKMDETIESTVLTPNLKGNPDEGKIKKIQDTIDVDNVDDFCNKHSISKNTLFMACTILTLNKFTFTKNTLITTIFNGRSNSNFYNTHAMLVKTVPLIITNENRKSTIIDFIKSVDECWKTTINNSFYPYTKIAEEYQLKPEFFYSYHEFIESEDMVINNKKYHPEELSEGDFTPTDYKIDLIVTYNGDNIRLEIGYNNQLYSEDYIKIFIESMKFILKHFLSDNVSKSRICDISLADERKLFEFTKVEIPLIHKHFEKQVNKNPDHIALVANDATLTYKQLNEKANIIANALIKKGIKPKSNILIMLPRNSDLISTIYGVLKTGSAFIPIDPEYPQERINYIFKNSQADYIISNESNENSLDINQLLKENNNKNPNVKVEADDLAYMIYTSGSTGNPKGVMISHKNISNQVSNPKSNYNSLICITTISFDVSLDDILTSLSNGLKLILADDTQIKSIPKLTKLIKENKPEILDTTPSRLASYLEVKEFCQAIRCIKCIFLGGEQFSSKVFENLRKYSNAVVYNSYGPTETTITSNNKKINNIYDINVGHALKNYITDVRDIDGKLLPQGVIGELYIGGTGVGKGYYNMPEKTKERFITIDNIPYYKSGDYAIKLPNDEIDIKGRIDNQIKLRGLRIEIGEIETNINKYPKIKQTIVLIKEINGYDHLCAYYTGEEEINSEDLKEYLKDHLTRYMIPTVFIQVDKFPQTPNGKTDLKQLPEPKLKLALVMPETETEEKIYNMVSSIVNIDEFGVTDDLYALGFTSLTLMKLNSLIYEQIGGNLDISILFNEPSIRNFAIELDNSFEKESDFEELIESAKDLKYYPLTENQLGVYYECVQNPNVIKYTMPTVVRFKKDVDPYKLKEAIIKTIESHPYIKTRIVTHDGELKQKRSDDIEINNIEIIKVDHISDEEISKNDVGPILLDDNQLFKFKIYETHDEIVLFSDFHHIITDGVSQNNLYRDIANIYRNESIEEEIIDGYTYSILEKDKENSKRYQSAKEFFNNKLSQQIESTVLTPNLNGNPDEGNIKYIMNTIDSKIVNEFCNDNSISKNTLFMAILVLNLNKFTFTDKTLITTIFNGRTSPNYFNTQGFLVKTIPFIINNENRDISLRDFINSVNQVWKDSLKNSVYPYTKIAEEYQLKPEFFYSYHEFLESDDMKINNKIYEPKGLSGNDLVTTDSKISLSIYDEGDNFNFIMEYNDQLYSEDYIKLFLKSMENILVQILEEDNEKYRICDVKLKYDDEIHEFKKIELPFIHKRFEKQVKETPDNIALVASDVRLTYNELNQKANRIANGLIKKGIKPNTNVLVMLPRNSNLISCILGVLKAGCAFIPIDITYPKGRIEYIFENSQADYIIADGEIKNSIDVEELLKEENTINPQVNIEPDNIAYMIYTSGSTGNPKGVMTSHKNITNLFSKSEDSVIYKGYSKMKKTLALSTVSFDAFLLDFMTLTFGLEMVLANDSEIKNIKELTELIIREKPDALTFTAPSRFKQYLEYEKFKEQVENFKYIGVGGEMVPQDLIAELLEYPNLEVYNIYGPTETTVTCNTHKITNAENISIGKALHNCITEVRDIDGKLLPASIMGELYIGGCGVSKGYYNMDEKTKESFININHIPYYRSGDYAIELPNGELTIKGRIDNQIKLRGLRIELGEIESNIVRFPNIKQTAVVIKKINNLEHLCAYFTSDETIDVNLLKRYLSNKLTEYMVPTVFMQIDKMPISPNGKTDIRRLPKPKLNINYVKAENKTEKKLVELVSSIADTNKFGTTDNLYELGFTSLTLMKLNSMIFNETNVNIDISSLFTNPTIKSLADKIDNNIETNIDIDEIIETAKDMEYFPLTTNQLGIYYECMQTDKIKYTMPTSTRFDSSIDPHKLKEAIIKTVEAHPYLKTRIVHTDDGKIMQKKCENAEIEEIEIVEIDSISNREIMEKDLKQIPIDDSQLFRFKIYKTPTETILFSDFHHIITDGVSQSIFFNDLSKAYENEKIEKEKVNGYAYSLIEAENSIRDVSKKFFKNQFSQGIESTILTPNINGNPDIGSIKMVSDELSSVFVRNFCQDHSISPNVLFMTATLISLSKFTFNDKSLITTIFNGRANSNFYNTQGMLVKTLPIIVNSENREMMVEDYIKIVDKSWKDALTHSNYPYTKLAEDYQLKPEFFYSYHESFNSEVILNDRSYETVDLDGTVTTDYKINFDIYDDGENIRLYLEYNDQIYTKDYVKMFLYSIKYILFQFFVNDMDKLRIKDIELEEGENPEFEELTNPFIHKRFEKQVNEKEEEIAVVATDATLSYNELNQKANSIANALIKKGIKPKSNILVMLPRDSNLIATIIGIFKAGCTFVPIDPEYPQERIDYIYENSQADYIINTNGKTNNTLNINELIKEKNTENPNIDISPDDLAYMIYTSGSTGKPKGVMISHKNACNEVAENPKCQYKSILSIATIAFDTSLEDILTGITNGIKIIFANDIEIKNVPDLITLINETQPEVMEFTPSRLVSYLEIEEFSKAINCSKCIVMGGEQFSAKAFRKVKQHSNAKVYNSYGPTEATIASNYQEITNAENITVGKPLKNYITEVRDMDGKLLPQGVMGELYIGGTGVAKGYYNMPEKTKEVYTTINNIPYYKSGDYAIKLPNGKIDIKGRIDNQIKLRGLRIEIGEIETNIDSFPEIKQNTVIIKKINNTEHLCAYFTAKRKINIKELKQYLESKLTKYMVPTVFMQLDHMPQLPNGKTDTKKLPEPKIEVNYVAPKTKREEEICKIFASILNIEKVGAEDNFFEIGGTSLIASKLIIELLKKGYSVKYDDIFRNKTPKALAKILSGENKTHENLSSDDDIVKNYNYDEINKVLEENTLENFKTGKKLELANVLLTGVTGFLGIHILYEFIKNEKGKIYCILRKGKFNSCKERLISLIHYYFDEDFTELIGTRIILIEGDITKIEDFKKLEDEEINTIINAAAVVKHYTADDYIFKVNVDGVKNGLEFAKRKNNIRYIQISTISVLSSYSLNEKKYPNQEYNERTLYYQQYLENKYIKTKFLAERLVLEAASKGLSVKIIRLGNLMSRYSDGMFQKNYDTNAFLNNLKAIKKLKAINTIMANEETDMSQIDYVAKGVLQLSKTPEKTRVLHCLNNHYIPLKDIVDVLNTYGYEIKEVDGERFKKIYEENMNENIQGIITSDITVDDLDEEDDFNEKIEIGQTTEILHLLGFDWPKPDKKYLKLLIDHLNKLNYFE